MIGNLILFNNVKYNFKKKKKNLFAEYVEKQLFIIGKQKEKTTFIIREEKKKKK